MGKSNRVKGGRSREKVDRRRSSPAAAYLARNGVMSPKSVDDFWRGFERIVGRQQLAQVFDEVDRRNDGHSDTDIYEMLYADLATARASIPWGAPMAQTWLRHYESLNLPGGDLLDIGCGFGFFTCFYALMRPDDAVVGIDSSRSGIETARALANDLGIGNATFVHGDLKAIDLARRFPVVVTTAVLGELKELPDDVDSFSTSAVARRLFCEGSSVLAEAVARHLEDDGRYVSYERLPGVDAYAYWIGALARCGLNVDPTTISPLSWTSVFFGYETMPAMVASRQTPPPTIESLFGWAAEADVTAAGHNDFGIERSLAVAPDLRFIRGTHFEVRDQFGRGATRVYLVTASERAVVYMTTSRGARKIQADAPIGHLERLLVDFQYLEIRFLGSGDVVGSLPLTEIDLDVDLDRAVGK